MSYSNRERTSAVSKWERSSEENVRGMRCDVVAVLFAAGGATHKAVIRTTDFQYELRGGL